MTTLLLEEHTKPAQGETRLRTLKVEPDLKAGDTCDRWGHPCTEWSDEKASNLEKPAEIIGQAVPELD